jgi:hypothetical protein
MPLSFVLPSGIPPKLALGSRPRLPGMTLASSLMMSPNKLLVTTTPFRALGFLIMSIAAESIRWVPDFKCGYSSFMMRSNVFRHNLDVASTFALSKLQTGTGGSSTDARLPANRTTRSISSTLYGSVSIALPSPSSSFLSPKYIPPVSSRMMVKFTPRAISGLRGDASTSESDAKKHGRRLPNVPNSLRSLRMPCSGRTFPVPHFCEGQHASRNA